MSLTNLEPDRDIAEGEVNVVSNFEILSPTAAGARNIVSFVPFAAATDYMSNAQNVATNTPLSAAFRQITNYFFSSSAAAQVPLSNDTNSTTSLCRIIQVGRTTTDDSLVSGSVTATMSFGPTQNLVFVDQPEENVTSAIGRKGSIVEKNDPTNIVGTIFYDSGTMIFHGGESDTDFIGDPTSGFVFGTGATAGKIAINNLSFQSQTKIKRSLFFCRAFNQEFNYTNNPTSIADASLGTITGSLTSAPTTFITSIALYNDEGEMMAIAKVSPPAKKDFETEQSFSVRLQY